MNDSDLLAKAAQAAGDDVFGEPGLWFRRLPHSMVTGWNPLTSDGDALRLAVKLKLLVDVETRLVKAMDGRVIIVERVSGDANAAARRAIVRMAADIAAAMASERGAGG